MLEGYCANCFGIDLVGSQYEGDAVARLDPKAELNQKHIINIFQIK